MSEPPEHTCWYCDHWHSIGWHGDAVLGSCEIPNAHNNPLTDADQTCDDWSCTPNLEENNQ